jgi:tetratricopeptide (TPR) repeat protein
MPLSEGMISDSLAPEISLEPHEDNTPTIQNTLEEIKNGDPKDLSSEEIATQVDTPPHLDASEIVEKIAPAIIEETPIEYKEPPVEKKSVHHKTKDHIPHELHKVDNPKKSHTLKPEKREKLIEITGNVKTLIARGQFDDARALIVSGLAIEKSNRELNLLMASLYERDHAFEKAEYILKDVATDNPDDIEVLMHLATDLAMQQKYDVAYELYKKILSLDGDREETLYTLTHLASEMHLSGDVMTYARAYLKQYPHNPEILWLYSESQIAHGERREAVETLIKLKNLTPYNQEIADLIQKLMTEEELAGNF